MGYWRSTEAGGKVRDGGEEFPEGATELDATYAADGPTRRRFLQLAAASAALAGMGTLSGCKRPEHHLLPYNDKPSEVIDGQPLYFATSMVLAGEPIGILAETHEGRPTKIEGNPKHPASGGATHVFAQASVLDLYDPNRSRTFIQNGQTTGKEAFLAAMDALAADAAKSQGSKVAILMEDDASAAGRMLIGEIRKSLPNMGLYQYEPTGAGGLAAIAWTGLAAGVANRFRAEPEVSAAKVIVSLDCDFLGLEDRGVRNQRAFAAGRNPDAEGGMNRLYVVEPGLTTTGMVADHRLRLAGSKVVAVAIGLAKAIGGIETFVAPEWVGQLEEMGTMGDIPGVDPAWVSAVAADLKANPGKSLILAGRNQPQAVHLLAMLLNKALGNSGMAARYGPAASEAGGLGELADRLGKGEIDTLLIVGGNPAYDAPADLDFAGLVGKAKTSIRLALHEDETSAVCTWHVPGLHALESWDVVQTNGWISPVQPMIQPLFGGMGKLELLGRLGGMSAVDEMAVCERCFQTLPNRDPKTTWRTFLHEGVARAGQVSAFPDAVVSPAGGLGLVEAIAGAKADLSAGNLEIRFTPDASVFDGRFANNGWMQECPDPLTKLTWDNAAIVSPRTARELGLSLGDVVKLELNGRSIEIAVMAMPGVADFSVTLPLGYGRKKGGPLAEGMGFDVYPLRTTAAMGLAVGGKATKTGKVYPLATTQEHWTIAEYHIVDEQVAKRGIVREGTLAEYKAEPGFVERMGVEKPTSLPIYTPPALNGVNQWGMAVDLNTCTGCNGCVVACQAENNVPIVGKDEVIRGREMHWLRIDRYFHGADPEGEVTAALEPMMCQHCEMAPCEPVCPVNATVHDQEGLNGMVYNRCIGTRYCSNNCPYKVRRFNFFDWNKGTIRESGRAPFDGEIGPDPMRGFSTPQIFQPPMQELLRMQKNPDVTVRMRGVMEKCTFCVQRIKHAEVAVKVAAGQSTPGIVPEGMLQSACQQACPTGAIVFGNLADPESAVSKLKKSPRNYEVLGNLNTKPRTTYLARIRNENPALASSSSVDSAGHGSAGHGMAEGGSAGHEEGGR